MLLVCLLHVDVEKAASLPHCHVRCCWAGVTPASEALLLAPEGTVVQSNKVFSAQP